MDLSHIIQNLPTSWQLIFVEFLPQIESIQQKLIDDHNNFPNVKVFPKSSNIFKAFQLTNPENIKVVIIGQDCYHGESQATGLCFAVENNVKNPPSLRNIEKEIRNNIGRGFQNSNLEYLAKQGVLLLNCGLTVRQSTPGSHIKFWLPLIKLLLERICQLNPNVIFLLWGNYAKNIYRKLDLPLNCNPTTLEATHPSPLSANRGGWFGNQHFNLVNKMLDEEKKIDW